MVYVIEAFMDGRLYSPRLCDKRPLHMIALARLDGDQ
jgi:hypothetical protein